MAVDVEVGEAGAVRARGTVRRLARGRSGCRPASGRARPLSPLSSAMASSSAVTRQPAFFSCARSASKAARSSFFSAASRFQHFGREGRAGIGGGLLDQAVQRIADLLGRVDGGGDQVLGFDRWRRRSSRALLDAGRAAQQQIVEIHALRRAGDAHAPALRASSARRSRAPPPRRVRRHRRARSRRARRPADRGCAGRRSRAPPRPDGRSPAWRRGRSRCLRRPSARRPARRAAPRRRGTDRASSSADRPAPCRRRRGRGRCGGSRAACRRAARHQRHHRRPDAARGMLQPGMEAQITSRPAESSPRERR